MSDILSQEEVDALLSAVSAGDLGGGPEPSGGGDAGMGGGMGAGSADQDEEKSVQIYAI